MEPRLTVVTLGVSDLERAVAFYRDGLGWPLSGASNEEIAFFEVGGTVLALYPYEALAADANMEADADPQGGGFSGFTLAQNVADREQVSRVLREAEVAGAKIVKEAQDVFWGGHSGYFADPDGHLWEVAWSPDIPLAEDGSLMMPD
jgi:catechol 2,3-dioxygenase-like lactoylglutathione lyase family enzyme